MNKNIKLIAGNGILLALTIVFTIISNYIVIGNISINLSLIPIVIAGFLYGPISSLFMGLVNGAFIMLAPATAAFFSISIGGTILTCLTKAALAGLISTLLYKLIKNKNELVATIVASILAPILNTGIFICYSLIFYKGNFCQLITLFVSINFVIELVSTIILSPSIARLVKKRISDN